MCLIRNLMNNIVIRVINLELQNTYVIVSFLMSLEQYLFRKMLKSGGPRGKTIISVSGAASIRIGPLFPIPKFVLQPQLEKAFN